MLGKTLRSKSRLVLPLLTVLVLNAFGEIGPTFKSLEKQPDYVRPIVTLFGTMTNSGWYQSASIDKDFGFNLSLPISLTYINSRDKKYSDSYVDPACAACNENAADCDECIECQDFTAPTIFGSIHTPKVKLYTIDLDYNVSSAQNDPKYTDGIEELSKLKLLPFITLQAGFSYFYTELKLRYLGMPAIKGISVHIPGFGIQHDFQYLIPDNFPLSLSFAANFTILSTKWNIAETEIDEDITGELSLTGLTNFVGILAGYKVSKNMEVFLQTGWEHSQIKPSGDLVVDKEQINPAKKITGRNAFRAAINVAFPLGYHPVLGGSAGAEFANTINILSYKSKKKEDK